MLRMKYTKDFVMMLCQVLLKVTTTFSLLEFSCFRKINASVKLRNFNKRSGRLLGKMWYILQCLCYLVLYCFFITSVRIPEQYTTVHPKLLLSNSNSLCKTFLVSLFVLLVTLVAIIIIKSPLRRCHTHHTLGVLK